MYDLPYINSCHNKALLVVAGQARGSVVMLDGERKVLHPDSFSLLEGGAYLPAYVSISNLKKIRGDHVAKWSCSPGRSLTTSRGTPRHSQ
jgi:hypothetical protein